MKVRAHIFVSGKVQGVFFRATTEEMAQILGVKGWVKNTEDGKVEVMVEGEKEKVEKLIEWLHRGPPLAKVEKVETKWEEYKGEFKDFVTRYD